MLSQILFEYFPVPAFPDPYSEFVAEGSSMEGLYKNTLLTI